MGRSVINPHDLFAPKRTGNDYLDRDLAKHEMYLNQAVSKGVISPEQRQEFYDNKDRTWPEKIFGFEATGSKMQALVDVLMLPNYAAAALTKARTEAILEADDDDTFWGRMTAYNPASFSLQSFTEAFQERTTYGNILGSTGSLKDPDTWKGLALDIALDPTTYLTFGIGAGAKVAGGKTLTKWGARVHKEAVSELMPKLAKELEVKNAANVKKGVWGDQELFQKLQIEAEKLMVDDYERIAQQVIKKTSFAISAVEGAVTGAANSLLHKKSFQLGIPNSAAMFQPEKWSKNIHRREFGIWGTGQIERHLSKVTAKWQPADDFFRLFNQMWGQEPEVKQAWIATRDHISSQTAIARKQIRDNLAGLKKTDLDSMSMYLESKVSDFGARNATASMDGKYSDEFMEKAEWVRRQFDEILDFEQAVKITGDGADEYVTHLFGPKVLEKAAYMAAARNEFAAAGNQFAKHRMVAKIADLEGIVGEGNVMTNIAEILYKRKRASIEMVAKKNFKDEMIAKHGMPAYIINETKGGISHPFRAYLAKKRDSRVYDKLDQVWADPDLNIAQLGFKEGEGRHNRDIIRHFTTEPDKLTPAAQQIGEISPMVQISRGKAKLDTNINEVLAHIYEDAPLKVKLTGNEIVSVIKKFDNRMRENGIGPILSVLQDVDKRVVSKYKQLSAKKLSKTLNRKYTHKLVAQLPEEMVLQFKQIRRAHGDLTDTVKPSEGALEEAQRLLKFIGFKGESKQVFKHMFDKTEISQLSAREIDVLNDYLRPFSGTGDRSKWKSVITHERMTRMTFASEKESLASTNFKEIFDNISEEVASSKDNVAKLQEKVNKVDLELRMAPRGKRKELLKTKQQLAEGLQHAERINKLHNMRRSIVGRQGEKIKGESVKGINKAIKEAERYAKKHSLDASIPDIETISEGIGRPHAKTYDELTLSVGKQGSSHWFYNGSTWYLPHSIVSLMGDVDKKLYGHELGYLMRGYDFVQNLFKAPIMAPFVEFYKRNGVTSALLTHLRCGVSMLNPTSNKQFLQCMSFVIAKQGVDINPLRTAASGVLPGNILGGSAGAVGGYHEDAGGGIERLKNTLIGGAVGGLAGAAGGAALGGAAGGAMRLAAKAPRVAVPALPGAIAGATAGGIVGEDVESVIGGAIAGAVGGAAIGMKTVPKDLEKLAKTELFTPNGWKRAVTVEEFIAEAGKRGVLSTRIQNEIFETGAKKDALFMNDLFRTGELASDIPTRLNLFMHVSRETGSFFEAGNAVKNYLYDYASLSNFERRVMRRAIPFYTWVKHALTISYDGIIKHPGRVSAQLKFVQAQNPDVDPADVPDWLRDRLSVIKVNDDTGEMEISRGMQSLSGIVLEDAVDIWRTLDPLKRISGDLEGIDRIFARGPFGVTSIAEAMINKDFFFNRAIRHTDDYDSRFASAYPWRDSPEWLKQAVGYKVLPNGKDSVDPQMAWMIGEVPYSRFISVIKNIDKTEDGELNWLSLARQVFGEKIYKSDGDGKYYEDKARLEKMAVFLKKYRVIQTMHINSPQIDTKRSSGFVRTEI